MFKKSGFEDEIYRCMEKQLVSNQVEDNHGFKRIAKAAEYLEAAAEIFDQAGMTHESEETISVLHSLAMEEFSITNLAGLEDKDLHNILEMSTPSQLMQLYKKVSSVVKNETSLSDTFKESLKEKDLSDPEVRSGLIDKLKSALKLAKFFA